jgi:hypothetical protein
MTDKETTISLSVTSESSPFKRFEHLQLQESFRSEDFSAETDNDFEAKLVGRALFAFGLGSSQKAGYIKAPEHDRNAYESQPMDGCAFCSSLERDVDSELGMIQKVGSPS